MRLLVTGGSGFIGTNLMAALYLPRASPCSTWIGTRPWIPVRRQWWKEVDLMDRPALRRPLMEFKPTHIVHLAARTDTDEKVDVDAYRQNHEGTRILLEVVKDSFRSGAHRGHEHAIRVRSGLPAQARPRFQAIHRLWRIEAPHGNGHAGGGSGLRVVHHSTHHHLGGVVLALPRRHVQGDAQRPVLPSRQEAKWSVPMATWATWCGRSIACSTYRAKSWMAKCSMSAIRRST